MRTIDYGDVRIRWPARARRALLPSRAHDLAVFEPSPLPVVQSARLAARWLDGLPTRRRVPPEARALVARLRPALVLATEADYAAAARACAPQTPLCRALLASAFTGEVAWTRAAAEAYLACPRPAPLIEDFGPFVADPALAMSLARASVRSPYGLRERALDLLAHLGAGAIAPLRFMLFERWSDSSVRPVARALALVEAEAAGRALLPLLAAGPLKATARSWAKRHRDLSIPLLRELEAAPSEEALDMAQREELRTVVEPILRALDPPAPSAERWPEDAPPDLMAGPALRSTFLVFDRLPRLRTLAGDPLPAIASARLAARLRDAEDASAILPACDPEALARLTGAVYDAWLERSGSTREGWVLSLVGLGLGDDRVEAVAADAERAHAEGRSARAARLLESLAERASPHAWMHVERIAQASAYLKLRRAARSALRRAAARRERDPEELADASMPTLGLDTSGERRWRLGEREIVVCCDETLIPKVLQRGALRPTFPPQRVADDPARYEEARAGFRRMKREAKLARETLTRRLERMMVEERGVEVGRFEARFVAHPLVRTLVERLLLWTDGGGVRLAEDATWADVDDRELALAPDAALRIVHPARLEPAERAAWSERFAEYALTQPFRQLGRPVWLPTDAELHAERVLRLEGQTLPFPRFAALRRRGWTGRSPDGIRVTRFERTLDGIGRVALEIHPGLHVGSPTGSGPQRIVRASIDGLAGLGAVLRCEAMLAFETLY